MGRRKFSEDRIHTILDEYRSGADVVGLCQKHGMSRAAFYKWRTRYPQTSALEPKNVDALEKENLLLKRLLAEVFVENHTLKSKFARSV